MFSNSISSGGLSFSKIWDLMCEPSLTMDILDAFPSKYLKGSDFPAPVQYSITGVAMEQMQDGTSKPAVSFNETQQLLILNKTNSMMLASFLGSETTGWPGNKIELFAEAVPFQGKIVQSIRVRKPAEPVPAVAAVTPAPAQPAADVDADVSW